MVLKRYTEEIQINGHWKVIKQVTSREITTSLKDRVLKVH